MYFVNLSTITRIESNLFFVIESSDFGNFVIKSIIIEFYSFSDILVNLIYPYNKIFNYFILLTNNTVTDIRCNLFLKFEKNIIFSDKFNRLYDIRIFLKRVIIIVSDNIIDYFIWHVDFFFII